MLLWTLVALMLGNMFTGKRVIRAGREYYNMNQIDKNI